jgi:O-antigen biosynthesis protein
MQIKTAKVTADPFSRSAVDIIIPFYGQYDRVAKLVESIWITTRSNPYNICLVDDASHNADFINNFKDQPQVTVIRAEKRLGFGGALKLGYEATSLPWVLFLNSDCEVQEPGWMVEMGRSLISLKDKGVRMVSAKTNNSVGGDKRQEGGKRNPCPDSILEDGFLSLYCTMCHRQLFQHIGGFIKNYPLGGFEDQELAFRLKSFGFKQAVCGRSWIFHEGYATIDAVCKEDSKNLEIMENNRLLCSKDILAISHK